MNDEVVKEIWQQHKEWSAAADHLKSDISFWRTIVLLLAIGGAFLATLSTQVPTGPAKQVIAWIGAVFLAIIPIATPRKLSPKQTEDWTRARSVSEGLKGELYTYFAKAAPYTGPPDTAVETLRDRILEITEPAQDLVKHLARPKVQATSLPIFQSPDDYLKLRVSDQIDWYKKRAALFAGKSSRLRAFEFFLAISAALLAAATGVWGEALTLGKMSIAIGAWVAVLTTIGGTLTSHIAAERYDHLVTSYSATAHQLRNLKMQWSSSSAAAIPSQEWSDFVRQCEDAISKENKAWIGKWVKENP